MQLELGSSFKQVSSQSFITTKLCHSYESPLFSLFRQQIRTASARLERFGLAFIILALILHNLHGFINVRSVLAASHDRLI